GPSDDVCIAHAASGVAVQARHEAGTPRWLASRGSDGRRQRSRGLLRRSSDVQRPGRRAESPTNGDECARGRAELSTCAQPDALAGGKDRTTEDLTDPTDIRLIRPIRLTADLDQVLYACHIYVSRNY